MELEPSPRVTREGAPPPSTSLLHPPGGHRGPGHGKQNPGLLPVGTERQGSFAPLYPLGDHPPLVACSRQVPGDWRDDASEIGVVLSEPPLMVRLRRRGVATTPATNLPLAPCSSHCVAVLVDRWGLLMRGAGVGRRCWCPEGGNGVRGDTLELWSPGSPRQPAGAVGDPTSRDRTGSGPFPRLEAASDQQQCGCTVLLVSRKTRLAGSVSWKLGGD